MSVLNNRNRAAYRGTLDPLGTHRQVHVATIPANATLEDITAPSYFWTVAGRVNAFDTIEAQWEDGSRVVCFRVMEKDKRSETLLLVKVSEETYPEPPMPPGYALEFVNSDQGWRVIHAERQTPLRGGFSTALAAANWLRVDEMKETPQPAAKQAPAATGGKGDPKKPAEAKGADAPA